MTLLDTRWRPSKAKWGASGEALSEGKERPTHWQTEWIKVTDSQREVSQLRSGDTSVSNYVRVSCLSIKPPRPLSGCPRQRDQAGVVAAGSCQPGEGHRTRKVCVKGALLRFIWDAPFPALPWLWVAPTVPLLDTSRCMQLHPRGQAWTPSF